LLSRTDKIACAVPLTVAIPDLITGVVPCATRWTRSSH
jgi:hypothetical protein